MKLTTFVASRRHLLAGAAMGALAWAGRPWPPRLRAQEQGSMLTASLVDHAPTDPEDPIWARKGATTVPLNPQNVVVPRLREAGAKSVDVRALYDADRLSILIQWKDAHKDMDLGTVMQYRDGAAIQFPRDPSAGPAVVTMGAPSLGVSIYHWKSDWQFARLHDVDEAYPNMYADVYQYSGVAAGESPEATDYLTSGRPEFLTAAAVGNSLADPRVQGSIGPVQNMRAEGFGTLEPDETQDGKGSGVWKDGEWRIAISIPRRQERFTFREGSLVPLAFAIWDGSRNERNGQKAFSDWQEMGLGPALEAAAPSAEAAEEGAGPLLAPLLGGIGGALALGAAAIIGLRMRRARSGRQQQS